MKLNFALSIGVLFSILFGAGAAPAELPARYFRLLEAASAKVQQRLNDEPNAGLKVLEAQAGWRHFPYAILAPAVLYAKQHPDNTHFKDPQMLALAIRIGDLLAGENEKG